MPHDQELTFRSNTKRNKVQANSDFLILLFKIFAS